MKNILITGGTGFIGSHLIKELVRRKRYKIRAFVRSESNLSRINDIKGIEFFKGDFYNPYDIERSLDGIDTVFHLASILGRGNPGDYERFNIDVSKKLLNFSLKKKIKKFVYVSSLEVYGGSSKPHIYVESDRPNPLSLYGKSKYEVEQYIHYLIDTFGLPATIIRAPAVYGPEDNFDRGFIKVIDLMAKNKFIAIGKLENMMSLIYIDNLIDVLITVAETKKTDGRLYLAADKEIYKTGEIYDIICKFLNIKRTRVHFPVWLISLISHSIELAGKLFNFLPWFPENYVHNFTSHYSCSINKIEREIGWKPKISTYEGLRRTIEWYKKINKN